KLLPSSIRAPDEAQSDASPTLTAIARTPGGRNSVLDHVGHWARRNGGRSGARRSAGAVPIQDRQERAAGPGTDASGQAGPQEGGRGAGRRGLRSAQAAEVDRGRRRAFRGDVGVLPVGDRLPGGDRKST